MRKRISKILLVVSALFSISLAYNNCAPTNFSTVIKSNSTSTGNPMAPVSNELLVGICGVINRCNPQVTLDQCRSKFTVTPGVGSPLGLSSSYDTFSSIIQGEQVGTLVAQSAAGSTCYDSINTLSCSSPVVQAAYNSSASNPFAGAVNLVSPQSCDGVFLPVPTNNSSTGWHLTLSDEFNGSSLNTNVWQPLVQPGACINGNNELGATAAGALSENGGQLQITATNASISCNGTVYPYTSGAINTKQTFSQVYGYFEMRAQIPSGQGFFPTFFLMPSDGSWPPEIVVMSIIGSNPGNVFMTQLSGTSTPSSPLGTTAQGTYSGPDLSKAMHVYSIDWEPNSLTWYIDGVQQFQTTSNIPNVPMYMIAYLAVGGDFAGSPDASTPFPSRMNIDYIRAWQK